MKTYLYLLHLLLHLWSWQVAGQIKMESITVGSGLSQGFVTSMLQDQRGFIWFGTFDGLNRYDGYQIKRFLPKPFDPFSIRSTYITALYEDEQHLLWVGTYDGLYIFDPFTEQFCFLGAPDLAVPAQIVRSINGDRHGEVLVVFDDVENNRQVFHFKVNPDFVASFDRRPTAWAGMFQVLKIELGALKTEQLDNLVSVGDSLLLLGGLEDHVYRYQVENKRFVPYDLSQIPTDNTIESDILWEKSSGRLFRCTTLDGQPKILPPRYWQRVFRFSNGDLGLWYLDRGPLLRKRNNAPLQTDFSRPKEQVLKDPLFRQEFEEILADDEFWNTQNIIDRSGIYWGATAGWGVRKINLNQLAFLSALNGHSISTLRELPDGTIWVRTYSDRTFLIDPKTLQIVKAAAGDAPYWAYELLPEGESGSWLIFPHNPAKKTKRLYFRPTATTPMMPLEPELPYEEGVPERLFKDRAGNVWVAAHRGVLLRARPNSFQFETFNYGLLLPEGVRSSLRSIDIRQDADGDLWIGSNKGLVRVRNHDAPRPDMEIFQHQAGRPGTISSDWVNCILPDPGNPDLLWIGTRGGGLNRLSISARHFDYILESPNGFPNNVVYGILPDAKGNFWCSTNRGICRFNPAQNTFVTYLESDGLLNTEFNTRSFLKTRDGRFWFGGVSGLNVFFPEHIEKAPSLQQVAITDIKVQGQSRKASRSGMIVLESEENNISFEFSAMDYTNPATNRYRYRLKGGQDAWVYSGNANFANFSALAPGLYEFEVQGATADGDWSARSERFTIRVRPPWYRSNFAWTLYLLLLFGAVLGYVRYREMVFKLEHAAEASRQESERLKAFEQLKNQFFANVAHELRTPLTVISGLAKRLQNQPQATNLPESSAQILRQSEQLLQLSNQMLDLAKLDHLDFELHWQNGNINEYIRQHTEAMVPLAASKGVELVFHQNQPEVRMDYDPAQLPKILNNLVSNAIRHTPPGGVIQVDARLLEADAIFQLTVSDSGAGIEPDDLPHIFDRFYQSRHTHQAVGSSGIGLTLTRDLVQRMGGAIQVQSAPGAGAVFTVSLPVKNRAPERLADAPDAVPELLPAQVEKPPVTTRKTQLPLLLLVEDNPAVVTFLCLCLEAHYRLEIATDGASGIEKALEIMPDLILTDAAMPAKSGYELISTLKNDPRTSHIPMAMLTARVDQADRIEAHRRGANAYIAKPFEEQELLLVLQNLTQLQAQWKFRYAGYWADTAKRPQASQPEEAVHTEDQFMRKLNDIFEANYTDDGFNLEKLCQLLNMSSSQLDRKIHVLTDQSPMQMLRTFRLQKARKLIQNEPFISIKEVCFRTGFKSPAHFSRLYAKEFGAPPSRE